jgi:hypothetical protein
MKLLINEPLSIKFEDGDRAWLCIHVVLDKFAVGYKLLHNSNFVKLVINAQKVSLEDLAMNELLFDGLWALDLDFRYAGLGGQGCETSFTVTQRD